MEIHSNGSMAKGLTQAQIDRIRTGAGSNRAVARELGISPGTVSYYRNYQDANGAMALKVDERPETLQMRIFDLPKSMSFQEWTGKVELGFNVFVRSTWFMADILAHPQADTDEGIQLIDDCAERLHLAKHTLANLKSLGTHFPPAKRHAALSASHHQALIPIALREPERLEPLMEQAEKEEWTVAELRKEISRAGKNGGAETTASGDDDAAHTVPAAYQNIDRHIADYRQARKDHASPKDINYELRLLYDAIADYLGEGHAA